MKLVEIDKIDGQFNGVVVDQVFINPLSIVAIWTGAGAGKQREPKLTYIGLLAAIGTPGSSNANTFIVTERSLDEVRKTINKGLR
jgi:hypothetical protein